MDPHASTQVVQNVCRMGSADVTALHNTISRPLRDKWIGEVGSTENIDRSDVDGRHYDKSMANRPASRGLRDRAVRERFSWTARLRVRPRYLAMLSGRFATASIRLGAMQMHYSGLAFRSRRSWLAPHQSRLSRDFRRRILCWLGRISSRGSQCYSIVWRSEKYNQRAAIGVHASVHE